MVQNNGNTSIVMDGLSLTLYSKYYNFRLLDWIFREMHERENILKSIILLKLLNEIHR